MKLKKKLALYGGKPIIDKDLSEIVFKYPRLNERDIKAVLNALKTCDISFPIPGGYIRKFEERISDYLGVKYVLTTNNGTSSIFSTFFAISNGMNPRTSLRGKEIICPSYTWWSSISPALHLGATPVFCEIDPNTLNAQPEDIIKKITDKTIAIMLPYLWGEASNLEKIIRISEKYDVKVIEDASHAFGGNYNKKRIGTLFDVGVFSLQSGKPLCAGEGGLLVTNNKQIYERAIILGHYERIKELPKQFYKYRKTGLGYKFRMSPLNAALAFSRLSGIEKQIKEENRLMDYFVKSIEEVPNISVPRWKNPKYSRGSYFFIRLRLELSNLNTDKNIITKALNAEGVPVKEEHYPLLHLQDLFKRNSYYTKKGDLPITETVYPSLIEMPVFRQGTQYNQVDQYVEAITKVIKFFSKE